MKKPQLGYRPSSEVRVIKKSTGTVMRVVASGEIRVQDGNGNSKIVRPKTKTLVAV